MKYISTRGFEGKFSAQEAIIKGIAPDGGLFVPESIPTLTDDDIEQMKNMQFCEISARVLSKYLDDFSEDELLGFAREAYSEEKWGENPVPLVQLNSYNEREYILELWHGPTCAFKDVALQMLPHLMTASMKKTGENKKICILTATSGDTGKAALEGFKDLPGTEIIVFYPTGGVSEAQKLQMVTTTGDNTHVIAVNGCFDDAQTGVKNIFADKAFNDELSQAASSFLPRTRSTGAVLLLRSLTMFIPTSSFSEQRRSRRASPSISLFLRVTSVISLPHGLQSRWVSP